MSGLYNLINGYNPACIVILPFLGRKMDDYPRFRDCFVQEQPDGTKLIDIYTRCGGGNRDCGFGEDELYNDPNFVRTEDDDFDCTYADYFFKVPDEWKDDFEKVYARKFTETSQKYQTMIREFWPEYDKQGLFDKIFVAGEWDA